LPRRRDNDTQGERGAERRLVPTGEHATRIGRLELRRDERTDLAAGTAIALAKHALPARFEPAGKGQVEHVPSAGQRSRGLQRGALRAIVRRNGAGGDAVDARLRETQVERVKRERAGWPADVERDALDAVEGEGLRMRYDGEFVRERHDGLGQSSGRRIESKRRVGGRRPGQRDERAQPNPAG